MYVTSLISLNFHFFSSIFCSSFVPDNSQDSKRHVKYSSVSSVLVHLFSSNLRVLFTYTLLAILLTYLRCLNRGLPCVECWIRLNETKSDVLMYT